MIMKSRSNHQALVMGVAILIMAYFPLMSAQNILLSVQRQINAPRVNYIGLNISYSCTLTYQGTTPTINEVEVDLSFSGPGIQNNSNNVRLSEVRRDGIRFQRILEFNPISAQDEGSYHCNGTIVSISDMQLIGMQEQTENIIVLKPTIDISLDPVYPVAERYLDIAPYNSFSFNCSAMITVQDTSVNLQRVFSWQRTIGGSSSNISAEIFTGSQSSTSGSSVLSINATEAGIHTYTCTVTLDVSPAPDIITSNSSRTRTIFGPSNPIMPMNVDTPSEYLFDNHSTVQWLVSSITYDPESYVVQYRPFESTCSCSIPYMNSSQITSGPNITRDNFFLSVELSDLVPGTTYEYRVIANNSVGITLGSTRYFTTTRTRIPEESNVGLAVGLSIFFIIIIIVIVTLSIIIGICIRSRYKENLKKLEEEKRKNQEQQRKLKEEEQKNQEQQRKLKEKEQIIQRLQIEEVMKMKRQNEEQQRELEEKQRKLREQNKEFDRILNGQPVKERETTMQSLSEDIEPAESGSRNHEAEPIENSLMDESMRQSLSEDIQPAAESGSRSHEAELNENSLIDESMGQSLSEDIRPAESGSYDLVYSKPSIIEVHQSPGITKVEVEELSFPLLTSNRVKGPWGIAVNKKGEIIVADNEANSIHIFTSTGKPITLKNKDQKLNKPCEVAIDASGNILVVDRSNHCVKKFRVDDQHLSLIQSFTNQMTPNRNYWPTGISIVDNKVYVTDAINGHVNILNEEDLEVTRTFGKSGSRGGEFIHPTSVTGDIDGKLYIVDNGNHRVQTFDPDGNFESAFGDHGNDEGQFKYPVGIAIDSRKDMLYISDRGNQRISMFKTNGQFVASFRSKECEDFDPCGLTVDENGKLYVCEFKKKRVLLFKIAIE